MRFSDPSAHRAARQHADCLLVPWLPRASVRSGARREGGVTLNHVSLAVAAIAFALYWLWRAQTNCPELERLGRLHAGDPFCRAKVDRAQCGLIRGHGGRCVSVRDVPRLRARGES